MVSKIAQCPSLSLIKSDITPTDSYIYFYDTFLLMDSKPEKQKLYQVALLVLLMVAVSSTRGETFMPRVSSQSTE